MRAISFLSRFTLICNICFVVFVIFGMVQNKTGEYALPGTVERVPFFKELVISLGFPAIGINFLMCLTYGILLLSGRKIWIPKVLAWINLFFLLLQVYYSFILK